MTDARYKASILNRENALYAHTREELDFVEDMKNHGACVQHDVPKEQKVSFFPSEYGRTGRLPRDYIPKKHEIDPWGNHISSESIEAIKICKTCPLELECLEYAMARSNWLDGIWGGTTPRGREAYRKAIMLIKRRERHAVKRANNTLPLSKIKKTIQVKKTG